MTRFLIEHEPNYSRADLAHVDKPVLVIIDAEDRVNPPDEHAQYIANNLPCCTWRKRPAGSRPGRSVIDEALYDSWCKKFGQPLYKLFGLKPNYLPPTSFTIAINEPEIMAERTRDCGYPILRIKLGSDKDEAIVAAIRKATNAQLRVDASAGWSHEGALQIIPRLAQHDLEFIEQPLVVDDVDGFF